MNILLITGNSQSTNTFAEQVNSPLLKEHDITIFDLEFEVNNLVAPTPENFFFLLKDKLLKLNNKKQFDCIVGHSWGGHLLVESVLEMENVKGIMVLGTPFMSKPPRMEESLLPNPNIPFFYTKKLSDEQLNLLVDSCLYNKSWVKHIVDGMKKASGVLRELTPASIAIGAYIDEVNAVAELKIPLAILHGEKETMVNSEYFASLDIPTLWQHKVQYIPNAGHFAQLENADVFNSILKKFLNDIA